MMELLKQIEPKRRNRRLENPALGNPFADCPLVWQFQILQPAAQKQTLLARDSVQIRSAAGS